MPMTTEQMVGAVKEAYEMFAAIQQFPGRRYVVGHLRTSMSDLHTELMRRKAEEEAAQEGQKHA